MCSVYTDREMSNQAKRHERVTGLKKTQNTKKQFRYRYWRYRYNSVRLIFDNPECCNSLFLSRIIICSLYVRCIVYVICM